MDSNSILLYSFFSVGEANIFAGMLRNEGIFCTLHDSNINSIYPLSNLANGGVKLFVNSEDFEKASEVLKDFLEVDTSQNDDLPYSVMCPNCGSFNSMKIPVDKMQFFDEFRCFDCDFEWDNKDLKNTNPGIWE